MTDVLIKALWRAWRLLIKLALVANIANVVIKRRSLEWSCITTWMFRFKWDGSKNFDTLYLNRRARGNRSFVNEHDSIKFSVFSC